MQTFTVFSGWARRSEFFRPDDPCVPSALREPSVPPELSGVRVPLPARKKDYTCCARTAGALWMGAPNGLTRLAFSPEREADRVMYFSAKKDLPDPNVRAVFAPDPDIEQVWVLTDTAAVLLTLSEISAEEKARLLAEESRRYVDRHGMVSQKQLTVPWDPSSAVSYGHSDNSGTFTAGFALGELFRYAYLKRTRGPENAQTVSARANAVRATEACQLLCYIARRGNGFVARTYITPDEPLPNDGFFYRMENGRAVCLDTGEARRAGRVGRIIPAAAPVPARLCHLFTDEGFTLEGLRYKGDTSSDEITLHFLLMYHAHTILGEEDPELDDIIKTSAKNILGHILDNGLEMVECDGNPTTWAKWSERYFATRLGWSDACLNAAELLMYHKVVMAITGETGRWAESYRELTQEKGYAQLTAKHDMRFTISAGLSDLEQVEELMYGDNMLATAAYWTLITLEEDEDLKALYRQGYKGWNGTFRREHNPGYDFPYMLACPDETVDTERLVDWFRRHPVSRMAAPCGVTQRWDAPLRRRFGGMQEVSWLLPPDEHPVTKYDRDPYDYTDSFNGENGEYVLESAYVYTFAYWLGKYSGILADEEADA